VSQEWVVVAGISDIVSLKVQCLDQAAQSKLLNSAVGVGSEHDG